jgi:FixJ family two-component response regulator
MNTTPAPSNSTRSLPGTAPSNSTRSLAGTSKIPLISIVDDDESVRVALKSLIDSVGFRAEVFGSGEEFLNSPYVSQTDCLIADVRMPGMSGLELQDRLNAANSSIPIVFISAHDDGEARARGLQGGAIAFLQKPFSEDSLLGAINASLDKS